MNTHFVQIHRLDGVAVEGDKADSRLDSETRELRLGDNFNDYANLSDLLGVLPVGFERQLQDRLEADRRGDWRIIESIALPDYIKAT